jgi:hypothetical protein
MLETRGPQGAVGHGAALEPTPVGRRGPETHGMWQHQSPPQSGGEVWSHRTRGSVRAHLSREARSGAIAHVTTPEPTSAESEVRNYRTHGSARAHLSREARFGAIGHVAAPQPTSAGR